MALGDVTTEVAGGEECVQTCCPENNCAFNDSTVCLTITTENAFFLGDPDFPYFFELNDDTPINVRITGQVAPIEGVGMFSSAPVGTIFSTFGSQMVILLSGQYDFEDGTTYCYRYILPFYVNCLSVDGILSYQLVVIHPEDVLTVRTVHEGNNTPADFAHCDYTTMGLHYINWGTYFVDLLANTVFEPINNPGLWPISFDTVPPCDGSEVGGHWMYGFSDYGFHLSNTGIPGFGRFNGCQAICGPSASNGSGGEHDYGPFFPIGGYTPRSVAGPFVAIADPMDLEVTVPGEWFNLRCGPGAASTHTGNVLLRFEDFTLKLHIATSEEGDDCPEDELVGGACYAPVNEIANQCPGVTPTTTTTTTSTSSTSGTSTTTTTTSSTTTTTTTTTTSTPPPPDDDRPECCPAGPFFPQVQIDVFVDPGGAGEACEFCASSGNAAWFVGEGAYIRNFFACGSGFTHPMQLRVYCIPGETEGTGQWYAELYCGATLMASMFLSNQSPNGLCDTEPPATMAGNDFSPNSTPCCATATIVTIVVNGIFTGGPL